MRREGGAVRQAEDEPVVLILVAAKSPVLFLLLLQELESRDGALSNSEPARFPTLRSLHAQSCTFCLFERLVNAHARI